MTTIKDRLKLFEASAPALKPKPGPEALLSHNKKRSIPEPSPRINKDEPQKYPVSEEDKDNINHICTESDQSFVSLQDPDISSATVITDTKSHLEIADNEESISNLYQEESLDRTDHDVDRESRHSLGDESPDDLDYELEGCVYSLPGVENFEFHDMETTVDSGETEPVDEEQYQIESITEPDEIAEPVRQQHEDTSDLKRSVSKRLIEEIFNTSIWRHSRNYNDDFIFCPAAESGGDQLGHGAVVVNVRQPDPPQSLDTSSDVTGSDERRKSTQSVSSLKPVRRSIFGNLFRSKRGAKKSVEKGSSPDKSAGGQAPGNDTHESDGVARGGSTPASKSIHKTDADTDSLDQVPKKPLNSIFNRDWLNSLGEGIKKKANVMSELRKVFGGKGKVLKKKATKSGSGPSIEISPNPNISAKNERYEEDDEDIYDDGENFLPEAQELGHQEPGVQKSNNARCSDEESIYDDGGSEVESNKDVDREMNVESDEIYDDGGEEQNHYTGIWGNESKLENNQSNELDKRNSTTQSISNCDSIYDSGGEEVPEISNKSPPFNPDEGRKEKGKTKSESESWKESEPHKNQKLPGKFGKSKNKMSRSKGVSHEKPFSMKTKNETSTTPLKFQRFFKGFSKNKVKEDIEIVKEVKCSIKKKGTDQSIKKGSKIMAYGGVEKKSNNDNENDNEENIEEYQEDVNNVAEDGIGNDRNSGISKDSKKALITEDLIYDDDNDCEFDLEMYANDSEDETVACEIEVSKQTLSNEIQISKNKVINKNDDIEEIYDDDEIIEEQLVNPKDLIKIGKMKEKEITNKPKKNDQKIPENNVKSKTYSLVKENINQKASDSIEETYDEDDIVVKKETERRIYIELNNGVNKTDNIKKKENINLEGSGNKAKNTKNKSLWNNKVKTRVNDVTDDIYDEDDINQNNETMAVSECIKKNEKYVDNTFTETNMNLMNQVIPNDKENKKLKDKKINTEKIKIKEKDKGKEKNKKKDKEINKDKENNKTKEKTKEKVTKQVINKKTNRSDDTYYDDDGMIPEEEMAQLKNLKLNEKISKSEILEKKENRNLKEKKLKNKDKNKEKELICETYDNDGGDIDVEMVRDENKVMEKNTTSNKKVNLPKDTKKVDTKILKISKDKNKSLKSKSKLKISEKDDIEINRNNCKEEMYDSDECNPGEIVLSEGVNKNIHIKKDIKKDEKKNKINIIAKPDKSQNKKIEKASDKPDDIYDEDESAPYEDIFSTETKVKEKNNNNNRLKAKIKNTKSESFSEAIEKNVLEGNLKTITPKEKAIKDNKCETKNKKQYLEEYEGDVKIPTRSVESKIQSTTKLDEKGRNVNNVIEEYDEDNNIEEYISDVEANEDEKPVYTFETPKRVFDNKARPQLDMIAELMKKQQSITRNLNDKANSSIQNSKERKTERQASITHNEDKSPRSSKNEKSSESDIFQTDDPMIRKMWKKNFDSAKKVLKLKEPVVPVAVGKALKTVYSQLKNHIQINIGELLEILEYKDDLVLVRNSLGKCGWSCAANLEIDEIAGPRK